jgi:hypothetical protein
MNNAAGRRLGLYAGTMPAALTDRRLWRLSAAMAAELAAVRRRLTRIAARRRPLVCTFIDNIILAVSWCG